MEGGCAGERRERKRTAPIILDGENPEKRALGERWESELVPLPKPLMILSPSPPLGEEVTSPSPDGEAALLRAAVTPPESIYSKSSGLSSAGLL